MVLRGACAVASESRLQDTAGEGRTVLGCAALLDTQRALPHCGHRETAQQPVWG